MNCQCCLSAFYAPFPEEASGIAKQWRPTPLTGSTACKKGALVFVDNPASWAASAFHPFPVLETDGAWQPWLLSKGLCPDNSDTAQALQALHPQDALPGVPPIHILPVGPRCLRAFPSETAPGPTGLRVQHLKDACVSALNPSWRNSVLSCMLAYGRAPDFAAPVCGGAGKSCDDWPQMSHARGSR